MWEMWVQSLGGEDLEKEMASHSSILAWETPWTEEPGRLLHEIAGSPWGRKDGHKLATKQQHKYRNAN